MDISIGGISSKQCISMKGTEFNNHRKQRCVPGFTLSPILRPGLCTLGFPSVITMLSGPNNNNSPLWLHVKAGNLLFCSVDKDGPVKSTAYFHLSISSVFILSILGKCSTWWDSLYCGDGGLLPSKPQSSSETTSQLVRKIWVQITNQVLHKMNKIMKENLITRSTCWTVIVQHCCVFTRTLQVFPGKNKPSYHQQAWVK